MKRATAARPGAQGIPPLLVVSVFVLAATLSLHDVRDAWRFPGLTAAQGAFATERPYEAFVALGHISPGAAYWLVGDPETEGSTWGGSKRWITEQLIGTARAASVAWRPDTQILAGELELAPGTRRWEGYTTLFGSLEVYALEMPVTEFLVIPGNGPTEVTRFVDVRLLRSVEILR
jgi:hypothetical protein